MGSRAPHLSLSALICVHTPRLDPEPFLLLATRHCLPLRCVSLDHSMVAISQSITRSLHGGRQSRPRLLFSHMAMVHDHSTCPWYMPMVQDHGPSYMAIACPLSPRSCNPSAEGKVHPPEHYPSAEGKVQPPTIIRRNLPPVIASQKS